MSNPCLCGHFRSQHDEYYGRCGECPCQGFVGSEIRTPEQRQRLAEREAIEAKVAALERQTLATK